MTHIKNIVITLSVGMIFFLVGKMRLVQTDNSIRAHTAAMAGCLTDYYDEHGELPHVLSEAIFVSDDRELNLEFSPEYYSPRVNGLCGLLYFPTKRPTEDEIFVATSTPVGPNIWAFSKRIVVIWVKDHFQVDYIDESAFQDFLREWNSREREELK